LQRQTSETRLQLIDFLRGVAILEMLAAHYEAYFPRAVGKLVDYTETAMPLFVLLAGFMVGWGYRRFAADRGRQTWVVWKRALRLIVVQYIIIATVGIPLFLLGMPGVGGNESLLVFTARSMTFLNQIGLLHILPTFIPLFAVSPAILLALTKGWDVPLLLASLGVFAIGHFHPYLLDLGDPTIFPFILVQLFFVTGCLLGKRATTTGAPPPSRPRAWLAGSLLVSLTMVLVVAGKVIPPRMFSLHPLNLFGLMYQAPIMASVWLLPMVFWGGLQRSWAFPYIARFGRHALLAFVLHLYLARALGVVNYLAPLPAWANYLLIAASVVAMSAFVGRYERAQERESIPAWARAIRWLFR
jgi:peptidoglycan/LPS O-acetylase OafA/YrhL